MKIVATSDLHGNLPQINPCDVLCICGDIIPLDIQYDISGSASWLKNDFKKWADSLQCERVIITPGNHDFVFEHYYVRENLTTQQITDLIGWSKDTTESKIVLLIDELYEFDGKTFYGTPWCPELYSWAFYKDHRELSDIFEKIQPCDVLLSHCPPRVGNQGVVLQYCWNERKNFGCMELMDKIQYIDIKVCLSGHIHSGNHNPDYWSDTKFVNVSLLDEFYEIRYDPYEFEI